MKKEGKKKKKKKADKVSEGEHEEGERNNRNLQMDIGPSCTGAVSVRDPHSQSSDSELYNHVVSYRAHVVEPESLLPRTEQRAPQWISLKAGAQETLGLTRDNIYPQTLMSCLEDCMHFNSIVP